MTDADKKSLQQTLRETWMSALGVLTSAEGELQRATQRLLDSVGLRDAPGIARTTVGELMARVKRNREVLERRVDEGVKAAVHRIRQPILDELVTLRSRVEQLQQRIELLQKRRNNKT